MTELYFGFILVVIALFILFYGVYKCGQLKDQVKDDIKKYDRG